MRRKLSFNAVQFAQQRLDGLTNINPSLDLGNGITVEVFRSKIAELTNAINGYNQDLSGLDAKRKMIDDLDNQVRDLRELTLKAVAVKYGLDSTEYVSAGGVRKSDKRGSRRRSRPQLSDVVSIADNTTTANP